MADTRTKALNEINHTLISLLMNRLKQRKSNYFVFTNFGKVGRFEGLYYKYYTKGNWVEFTHGIANHHFMMYDPLDSVSKIKFDSKVDMSSVTDMSDAFAFMGNLKYISFPDNFDTSNVKSMSDMFSDDKKLKHLVLPKSFNTKNVTNMAFMFNNMNNLESLVLPKNFDTSNVTDMAFMFSDMFNLQSITFPKSFNTRNVLNMSDMFSYDKSLKSLRFPKYFDTHNVLNMSLMFANTSSLRKLTLPEAFNTIHTLTTFNMFSGCGVKYLALPKLFRFVGFNIFDTRFLPNLNSVTLESTNNLRPINKSSLNSLYPLCWLTKGYKVIDNHHHTSSRSIDLFNTEATGTFYKKSNPLKLTKRIKNYFAKHM